LLISHHDPNINQKVTTVREEPFTMVELIDGKQLAKQLNEETATRVAALKKRGITPGIAVILVGDDPASAIYTRNKHRKAEKLGMKSVLKTFPADASQEEVMACVQELNKDPSIHAILVQSPLPKHFDEKALDNAIIPEKDVDGFHPYNVGRLYNDDPDKRYPVSCTPRGVLKMLDHYNVDLDGKDVVVMGRSILVGKPMQSLLQNRNATVTMLSAHTKDEEFYMRHADILIVAIGHPQFVKAQDVKEGAVVIDVGINRLEDGSLCGDVDFENVKEKASLITPVPGGVGPMTIASLMAQTVDLAEWSEE
jgi:methylenetetrahydrofolate dehydrogenase (NADP+) / methenyltetrahydrofolate cyclohydrolase